MNTCCGGNVLKMLIIVIEPVDGEGVGPGSGGATSHFGWSDDSLVCKSCQSWSPRKERVVVGFGAIE